MQADGAIIYAAGNPALYPLEYYDPESGTYQGSIPEFLAQFAREHGYDLRYLAPGPEDRRADLADSLQVDLISGSLTGEAYAHTAGEPIVLFSGESGGRETACLLHLTTAAPERLGVELRAYAVRTGQTAWVGELLASAGEAPAPALSPGMLWGAAAAFTLLLAALAAAVCGWLRARRLAARAELTDPETSLGTDAALEQAFSRLARDQSRRAYCLICIRLDLDRIGRLWGQERAAELLTYSAGVLREHTGDGDVPVRSGSGDLLVLKRFLAVREAQDWATAVVEEIRGFPFAGGELPLRDVSAGICPLEMEYLDLAQAVFHARQCAMAAGREERECRLCGTDRCRICQERWKLLTDFRKGLEREEFQLCLQFFVDARTFRIVGGETLSRWKHPRLGLLGPDRYIPDLEGDGRISALDLFGLERTCAFLEDLDRQGIRDFFLSCNFSRRTFAAPDFARRCIEIIGRHSFARKLLILEVTETQQIDRREAAQMLDNILRIRRQGARVIFDDFGMGFSSFHDLQDYPMDGLKLDKELVDNMGTERGRIILRALVDTGHRMGMTILAEGVENEEQIQLLQDLRCDVLQGFRFSVPLPAEEARKRILEEIRPGADRKSGGGTKR